MKECFTSRLKLAKDKQVSLVEQGLSDPVSVSEITFSLF